MFKKLLAGLLLSMFVSCSPTRPKPVACDFSPRKNKTIVVKDKAFKNERKILRSFLAERKIKWQPYTRTSLQLAATTNSIIILLIIQSEGCLPCSSILDSFNDSSVQDKIFKKFAPIKLDISGNFKAANDLGIKVLPTVAFLDSDFTLIGLIEGSVTPGELNGIMEKVVAKVKENSERKSSRTNDRIDDRDSSTESERELESLDRL